MRYDLRNSTAQEFERFLFDHEVTSGDDAWYHQLELQIEYDALNNARLYTDLFLNCGHLLGTYSPSQLEQGCWAMIGHSLDGSVNELIWESEIDISVKEALIAAMVFLYRDLFAKDPLEHACDMWWDGLAYDIHPMQRADPVANPDHRRIQQAMFDALCDILKINNSECQFAALHGLNHVQHPDTVVIVREFISNHPELNEQEVSFAVACAHGKAM